MKKNTTINVQSLLKTYSIEDIEKQLVINFLIAHNIDFSENSYLSSYLKDYSPNKKLEASIKTLNHISLEEITSDMELLIPCEDKKTNGAFFTPSYIADYIIENVNPQYNSKVVDLSCGSGAFILGLLKYYKKVYNKSVQDCVKDNIYGADILHYNIERCRLLIILFALYNKENIHIDDINLYNVDSLKHSWNIKFDAVVGNPPYVKFQDLSEDYRLYLSKNWETTQYGTYNLYFAFFELGLKVLNNNGKLGYITPNNYFTSLSGEYLRSFFQYKKCVYKIVDFAATKVFDVQTYTAITFLNKGINEYIDYDRIDEKENPVQFLQNNKFSANLYTDISVKKWRLLCESEKDNIYAIENCGERISSLFNICVGIATLKDDAYTFIPSREDDSFYYVVDMGVEYSIEKEATRPLVKISDMKCQQDVENNEKRIVFPYYIDKTNKPQLIPEDELQLKFPNCYNYLCSKKEVLENRGKGSHKYSPFYVYGRTQALNKKGKKLLTPTFSQYPRFLMDNCSEGLFTNGYGIYLNKQEYSLFDTNPISLEENFDVVQKILNSIVMHYYVKKTSVSIEGGYPCYQKNFIERFTIPYLSNEEIQMIREMNSPFDIDNFLIQKYQINLPLPNRLS